MTFFIFSDGALWQQNPDTIPLADDLSFHRSALG